MRLLVTFLALLWTLNAQAQGLIWSADNWAEGGWPAGASWKIAFDHVSDRYFPTAPSRNPATRIFFMNLGTNDTGRTFVADALNEPGFAGYVAGLTNGTDGYLRFQDGEPAVWRYQSEQGYLGRSSAAPDLAGYNITQINFRVNEFYDYYDVLEHRNFRWLDYSWISMVRSCLNPARAPCSRLVPRPCCCGEKPAGHGLNPNSAIEVAQPRMDPDGHG